MAITDATPEKLAERLDRLESHMIELGAEFLRLSKRRCGDDERPPSSQLFDLVLLVGGLAIGAWVMRDFMLRDGDGS